MHTPERLQEINAAMLHVVQAVPAMFIGLARVQLEMQQQLQQVSSAFHSIGSLSDVPRAHHSTLASIQHIAALPPHRRGEVLQLLQRWHDEDATSQQKPAEETRIRFSSVGVLELIGSPAQVAELRRVGNIEAVSADLLTIVAEVCPTATVSITPRTSDGFRETIALVAFPVDEKNAMEMYCALLDQWIERDGANVLTLQFARR